MPRICDATRKRVQMQAIGTVLAWVLSEPMFLPSFVLLRGSWEFYFARVALDPDLRKEVAVAVAMKDQLD